MRSRSLPQTYPPLGPAERRPPATLQPAIPGRLFWSVALAVGSSFYVAEFEPAPTDVLFLLLLIVMLTMRRIRFPRDLSAVLSISLFAFVASNILSLLAAPNSVEAGFFLAITLYLVVTWYLVVTLLVNYGAPMWKLILRAFLVAAMITAVIGAVSHFSTAPQDYLGLAPNYGEERTRGTFKDPNVYAPFLIAALLLVINQVVTSGFSLVRVGLLCLFSVEILAAFSRGGYVNLAVALTVFFGLQFFVIRRRDWLRRCLLVLGIAAFVIVPGLIVFLQTTGLEDFLQTRMGLQSYDNRRFETQGLALDAIAEAPFGIGPGESKPIFQTSPHNVYLRIAVENGMIAGLAFLVFLATTSWVCLQGVFRRHSPFRDAYVCCFAILVGIMVNSLVIDSMHWRHFFLFLALPIGLARYEAETARPAGARALAGMPP